MSTVPAGLRLRPADETEASALQAFVATCAPLDTHTAFTYWVLARYVPTWCFVAEMDGRISALLTAIGTDSSPPDLYLWQIGVDPALRGRGVAGLLLAHLGKQMRTRQLRSLEVSVSPTNTASMRTLEKFAFSAGAEWRPVGELHVVDPVFGHDDREDMYRLTLPEVSPPER